MDRLLVDVGVDGLARVTSWVEGEIPQPVGTAAEPMTWPLEAAAVEELRWYLEDYLGAPFGVYGDDGPRVAGQLPGWGAEVFSAVFGGLGGARDAYVRLRARGRPLEILFRSASPDLLGLPWELMRDPGRPSPLALDGVALSRSLPTAGLGETFRVGGQRLRVLMVISRPGGAADVAYQMIARPLLRRLAVVRGEVELVVLRPPTLDALIAALRQARDSGDPFQVVHFDGHGVLAGRGGGGGAPLRYGAGEAGVLVFEKPGGGADRVPAGTVAEVLGEAQVPVVVLNACQSGAVGKELEAAVATRLLQQGAASVVAMAYSVYAVAAAEFMTAFYERLFAGDSVTAAVTAGRARLARNPDRPSPKGPIPLADWVVPVHYKRTEVVFPHLAVSHTPAALDQTLDQMLDRAPADTGVDLSDPLAPVEEFVGRDELFYELEVALRLQRVVVLHGPGGTGKTELAKAFGRWWRATGGVDKPDWVIWHSFEPGVASFGLTGVIDAIGLHVFGADFARLDPDERLQVVQALLAERRLLLIWDNFETVHSMPDLTGATPPLPDEERERMSQFLHRVAAGGSSAIIITSRAEETWLGELRRMPVGGLTREEANEYADVLLEPYPAAAGRRLVKAFGELLQWLGGHPLSMRLILPHLATTAPQALLQALQGVGTLPGIDDGGRTASLTASVTYSYNHLGPASRSLLAAVTLFHGVVDIDVLAMMAADENIPERFRGHDGEAWANAMDEAARVGLLTPLGAGMYEVHPALPAYMTARWRDEDGPDYQQTRAAAEQALLVAYAAFGTWLRQQIDTGDAGTAFAIIDWQRRTLSSMLGHALDTDQWAPAQAIAEPMNDYWVARGLAEEARGWVDRVQLATEAADGTPPGLDTPAGQLWLFMVGSQANRDLHAGRLGEAETTYRDIQAMLNTQPTTDQQRRHLATSYGELGTVAQQRGDLDRAEHWYRQALTIIEELGDQPNMAIGYHQLGMVAQGRGDLDGAEDWYRKSLTIAERLGNRPGVAIGYHQLGTVAKDRGDLDEAEDWYRKSLTIEEQLGNRPGMATSYGELGTVAQQRGDLDRAEHWYRQALTIIEELGDQPNMAIGYHQLGMVAQGRGKLDAAEDWYRKSLTIEEQLGNRPGVATTYGQLGMLAEQRGDPRQALEWVVRCVTVFAEFPHPATGPAPAHLARLAGQLGEHTLEQTWTEVIGQPLPHHVRDYLRTQDLGTQEGETDV